MSGAEGTTTEPATGARQIHRLGSRFVNWFVVEEGGRLTAVDAGMPGHAKTLERDLAAIGHSPSDVAAVILTHSDGDHTGVVPKLRDAGARVFIHQADDAALRKPGPKSGDAAPKNLLRQLPNPRFWRVLGWMVGQGGLRAPKVEGAETLTGGETLDIPGRPRVIHTPGHTPGHCVFHFPEHGALFTGDALCTWDFTSGATGPRLMPRWTNISNADAAQSLAAFESLAADTIYPGHGDPWKGSPADAVANARSEAG